MALESDEERYRREHEEFVSNHGGTTARETVIAILPNVCSIILTMTTLGVIGKYTNRNVRPVVEFILTIVPCILCCTILSEYVVSVCLTMLLLSVVNVLFMGIRWNALCNSEPISVIGRRPFITNFRAFTNIITAVCILAVDFKVFPRKFAKTEVYGYSLMDTGVGLFMVANALVAPEAKQFKESTVRLRSLETVTRNFINCARSCTPLLILGFGRFVAVECLKYQRHISEYGIHWNFFVTLACVKIFTSMISSTISSKYSLLSGVWILMMHEYILSTKGLKNWVLSDAPRETLISANREGLASIPGYVGLYFIGVAIGRLIHSTYHAMNFNTKLCRVQNSLKLKVFGYNIIKMEYNESMILCIKLSLIAAQACGATLFCDSYFGISRRLANAGYCTWILTLSTIMLTILLFIEIIMDILIHVTTKEDENVSSKRSNQNHNRDVKEGKEEIKKRKENEAVMRRVPEIFEAVNYNGLGFFCLNNLLTGVINMLVRTLYVDEIIAIQILIAYMIVNVFFFLILYRLRVQIKL